MDSLRAIAVFFVIVAHVFPRDLIDFSPFGVFGVQLFFCLSGFLITAILLNLKDCLEAGTESLGFVLRRFYIRRSLRIFPLYYLALLLLIWIPPYREYIADLWWFLLYGVNWLIVVRDSWLSHASHLWTLAIEEQFYLVWPAVVLLVPRRRFGALFMGLVVLSVGSRVGLTLAGWSTVTVGRPTFANLDSLVAGSWLAVLRGRGDETRAARFASVAGWVGLSVLLLLLLARQWWPVFPRTLDAGAQTLSIAGMSTWIIHRASLGFGGWAGRILAFGPLVYTGRISYGIYVLHNLIIAALLQRVAHRVAFLNEILYPLQQVALLGIFTVLSIMAAMLSWHLFEGPINNLKRHYPYRSSSGGSPA